MIKYIKLQCKQDTTVEDFKEYGIFKKDNIYIGKVIGHKSVIVYDENKNGIYYNTGMPSCFGYLYTPTKDIFNVLEGEFLVANKKELRLILQSFQSRFK